MMRILLKGGSCLVQRGLAARVVAAMAVCSAVAAQGQDDMPALEEPPAVAAEQPPAEPASREKPAPPPPKSHADIEGAIGPVVSITPEYQGAARWATKVTPGIFIRWGRFTLTNASGFVTRREDDDVFRGLAADFVRTKQWRVNLALRIDRGRNSSDSAALSGLQDVRSTVRGRLIVTRWFDDGIGATLGTSADLLGRGGGTLLDLGLNKTFPIAPKAWWNVGVGVAAADQRYMQSYFGITPQQAASSGYAVYTPSSGLRDASAGISLRGELGDNWVGFTGLGYSHLLGPASASPLSQRQWSWGINGGLAWRF